MILTINETEVEFYYEEPIGYRPGKRILRILPGKGFPVEWGYWPKAQQALIKHNEKYRRSEECSDAS